jgi:hypothetical protein
MRIGWAVLVLASAICGCVEPPEGTPLYSRGPGESCTAHVDCQSGGCSGGLCSGGECPCPDGWECRTIKNPDPLDEIIDPFEESCFLPCATDGECPMPWTCHEADRCRYVPPPLEFAIEGPEQITLGGTAHYRGVVTSSDGPIALWRWSFGMLYEYETTKVEGGDEIDRTFEQTGIWEINLFVEEELGRHGLATHFTEVCTTEQGAACNYSHECCSPLACSDSICQ